MTALSALEIYESFSTFSGRAFLEKLRDDGTESPLAELLNLSVVSVTENEVGIQGVPTEKFFNPMMRIHGGWTAALIDTALGSAVLLKLPAGNGVGTVQLNVHYVKKIDLTTGPLLALAKTIHAGRTMLTAEAKVTDKHGNIYAHGTGTFMIYPKASG